MMLNGKATRAYVYARCLKAGKVPGHLARGAPGGARLPLVLST
jgi:hypothetical protein